MDYKQALMKLALSDRRGRRYSGYWVTAFAVDTRVYIKYNTTNRYAVVYEGRGGKVSCRRISERAYNYANNVWNMRYR